MGWVMVPVRDDDPSILDGMFALLKLFLCSNDARLKEDDSILSILGFRDLGFKLPACELVLFL